MKNRLFALPLVVLLLGACAAPRTSPTPGLLAEANKIIVVPVGVSAPAGGHMDGWVLFGSASLPGEEGGAASISDALSLFARELEHENLPAKRRGSPEGDPNAWNPALILAREAAALISSASPCEVLVREEQYTLSSSGRIDSGSALQEWYGGMTSTLNPAGLGEGGKTRVLELGLPDYGLLEDRLVLQVLVKVVDPSTGQVVARAGNRAAIDIGSPEKLFIHGGRKFKTVFAAEGRRLLERNLRDLGLIPGSHAIIN